MEEKQTIYEDENLNKLKDFAKEIIVKFVEDKLANKKEGEKIQKFIENTKFLINENMASGLGGMYHGTRDKSKNMPITIPAFKIQQGELIDTLETILHELQHKFSNEFAKGENISSQIEEGMADLFAEESLNYYIKAEPQKLEDFATSQGMKYKKRSYVRASSDYIGEREFTKTIIDAIRQTTGKHSEAEFAYTFGDKDTFLQIVRESLGDEGVELILQQGQEQGKTLAKNYDYSYNERLKNILEKTPLTYKEAENNPYESKIIRDIAIEQELTNSLQNAGFDLFNLTPEGVPILKKCLEQKSFLAYNDELNEKILKGYILNCADPKQLIELLEIVGISDFSQYLDGFVKNSKMNMQNILHVVGKRVPMTQDSTISEETIKQISLRASELNVQELTDEQINGLVYVALQTNMPNKDLTEILNKIENTKIMSTQMQLQTGIARVTTSENPKGAKWAELIEKYCASEEVDDVGYLLNKKVNYYFENDAKDDREGINKITSIIKRLERKQEQRRRTITK